MKIEDINRITVVGAGHLGQRIACLCAEAGYDVALRDINREAVEKGMEGVKQHIKESVDNGDLSDSEAENARNRLQGYVDIQKAVGETDYVIEAVPEIPKIKENVWRDISDHAPDDAVFTSNSSSISTTKLAGFTDRPEKFAGMHFFQTRKPVEVIYGDQTSEDTIELVSDVTESIGKEPVTVQTDRPGFIGNRNAIPLTIESGWLLSRGEATVEEIDSTVKYGLNIEGAPLITSDSIGIDVVYDIIQYVHSELGDAYKVPPIIEAKYQLGKLGVKTGEGFYDYSDGEPSIPEDEVNEEIKDILIAVCANEAARTIQEGVADAEKIDWMMKQTFYGGGKGPAEKADDHGLDKVLETLENRYELTGAERYRPAEYLVGLVEEGRNFHK
ncbi:MAG: 3-hydroxyacyl-CoA dehydrogenase NAD-binding domain-containing protein [Halobacteria archaeon]